MDRMIMGKMEQVGQLATTIATTPRGFTVVTYHNTQVVRFSSRKIILNTGGHNTTTTRLRMNQASKQYALGFRVFQKNHELFVEFKGCTRPFSGRRAMLTR